jgi:type IV pilus assembly protein PilY1
MKTTISTKLARVAAVLALVPGTLLAATTNIAQVPLLNIDGTGSVKPNLMLLFDNSGSMEQSYTPDYINDNICRSRATLAAGKMGCNVGHPPFMSSDFNRQYYNPKIRYQPPVKWDLSSYPEQNKTNTSTWSNVKADGYNKLNTDLAGGAQTAINLAAGFPDLKWCTSDGSDCKVNTGNYAYPNNTYNSPAYIYGAPYYWVINNAEWCKDANMTSCVSTAAGAAAPAGFPIPAKVRWCNSTALTKCQAKHVGAFIYPRYSTPAGAIVPNGTIVIGATKTVTSMTISQVAVTKPSGPTTVITNTAVTAPNGTDTTLKQQTVGSALAASIIAGPVNGSGEGYWACVKSPIGAPTVSACSVFGVPVADTSTVVVLPIVCGSGSKDMSNCQLVNDDAVSNTRSGWGMAATTPSVVPNPVSTYPATGVLRISGTASSSGAQSISSVSYGGSALTSAAVTFANNDSASTIRGKIISAINAGPQKSHITAYANGNAVTGTCAAEASNGICIVDTSATTNGTLAAIGSKTGLGSVTFTAIASTTPAEAIPTVVSALSSSTGTPDAFVRVDLLSGKTYPKGDRPDCVASAGVCTYEEEMTNFANWYTYYKTRLQMMKTSLGLAFAPIDGNYRVGYARLSAAATGSAMDMKPADFTGTSRSNWYTKLYDTTTSGSTPSRPALDNVGRMFGNLAPYNYAAGSEVVQFPCQQNFMIFTTDGYWNGGSTANVVNNDNVDNKARFCTPDNACLDTRGQDQPSLADVALHWYNGGSSTSTVSLRPDLEPDMSKPGLVSGDNTHLHVNTYTLGLGMDGVMTYEKNYAKAPKPGGDFYNLRTGVTSGCPWNGGGAYAWPDPDVDNTGSTVQERVDDLWHAAVNGHGRYFSASEPKEVVDGLNSALDDIKESSGAAAAAATSTPNISQADRDIFAATFTTVKWYGELSAKKIDTTTGEVEAGVTWTTSNTLGKQVASATDSRKILMHNGGGSLVDFSYAALGSAATWFDNKCTLMSQCALLSTADRAIVNNGNNLVNWLRGQQQYANDLIFRAYTKSPDSGLPIVLGDIASSKPAYVREPRKDYADPTYQEFKAKMSDVKNRPPTVYVAANDGMLHAFNATDGTERWAYVPRITMKKLYNLANTSYDTNHMFTTDGSPEIADVQFADKSWHTVLVAGLNAGGRGFYALDVTDATAPKFLWELCADNTVCTAHNNVDIGLTFGNAQFGKRGDKWLVYLTSGYNNVSGVDGVAAGSGEGKLFAVDIETGNIASTIGTGVGDSTTPSGLAKITAITDDPTTDPVITHIYGGDILGKMWHFDMTDPSGAVKFNLMGDVGPKQPITARPDVTLCAVKSGSGDADTAQRVVLWGTGRLLDVPDVSNVDVQSLYLLKDNGTNVGARTAVEQTLVGTGSSTRVFTITPKPVDLKTQAGWFLDWKLPPAGERMNLDPKIVSGVANVVTNIPSSGSTSSCQVGGSSNVYAINVCTGGAVSGTVVGGTLSSTSATVGSIIVRLPGGKLKMIATTAKGKQITVAVPEGQGELAHPAGWRRVKGD